MVIYIIIALSLLLFAVLSDINYFREKKVFQIIFLICGCIQLFFVSGFRVNTGHDYPAYTNNFISFMSETLSELSVERMEKGYVILNRYIQLFTNDFRILFIVVSLIVAVLTGIVLYKYCRNPSLGLLMFYLWGFYFNSMNFMRAMIAALIILFAYKYIRDKQFWRFFVIVLLASAFHFSALLMIPFFFILHIKINYKTLSLFGVIGGVIFILSNDIISFFSTYIYTSYNPETEYQVISGIPIAYSIFGLTILVCAVLLKRDIKRRSGWGTILISAAFFDLYCGFVGFKHAVVSRFGLYFGPMVILVLLPFIIRLTVSKIVNKTDTETLYIVRNYVCLIGTSLASIAFFAYALFDNYNNVIPHQWIWNLK